MPFDPAASALRRRGIEVALIGVTVVWGLTFVVVKEGVERVPVYTFNGVRFLLAAVVLAVFCLPGLRRLGREGYRHGVQLGGFLFAAYALQTVGLQHTQASRAGFVTGMFVVFVPLLSALLLRRRPHPAALLGVILAATGLALLTWGAGVAGGSLYGDLLVLGCAVAFAAHIIGLGAWSARHEALPLTAVQMLTVGVLHTVGAAVWEPPVTTVAWDGYVVVAILVTALLASAAAFWIQTAAQKVVPPTRTALILVMEPVFAGLFGYLLLGERLTPAGWIGSVLILSGMLLAELRAAVDVDGPSENERGAENERGDDPPGSHPGRNKPAAPDRRLPATSLSASSAPVRDHRVVLRDDADLRRPTG